MKGNQDLGEKTTVVRPAISRLSRIEGRPVKDLDVKTIYELRAKDVIFCPTKEDLDGFLSMTRGIVRVCELIEFKFGTVVDLGMTTPEEYPDLDDFDGLRVYYEGLGFSAYWASEIWDDEKLIARIKELEGKVNKDKQKV